MTACRFSMLSATSLLVITGCHGASEPKVTLRYHPAAGAAYHYALEQQNAMGVEGGPTGGASPEQTLTMRIYYTQRVKGPAQVGGGGAAGVAVTTTFDSTALDASGGRPIKPARDQLRGERSDMVYDDRMQVVSATFSGLAGAPSPATEQIGASVRSVTVRLPEAPVGVGDSWVAEQELPLGSPLSPKTPVKARSKLTVRQILVAGPDTSVLLGVETSLRGDPVEVTQQGQQVSAKLAGRLMGAQVFSLSRGVPVRSTMAGTMHLQVPASGRSPTTMAMRQRTSLRLLGRD